MSSRSSHVRLKVVALLASMTALWAFAAFVTVREGLNLLSVSTLDSGVGRPTVALLSELQEERRLSMVNLGRDGQDAPGALAAQRSRTDAALATFLTQTSSGDVAFARSPALALRINDTSSKLQTLATLRAGVDQRSLDRARAAGMYTTIVDAGFRIFDSLATLDDKEIAKDIRTLIVFSRAREVLSQEDALLAGALAAGELTAAEHIDFIRLVGTQRFLYDEGVAELPRPIWTVTTPSGPARCSCGSRRWRTRSSTVGAPRPARSGGVTGTTPPRRSSRSSAGWSRWAPTTSWPAPPPRGPGSSCGSASPAAWACWRSSRASSSRSPRPGS